MPAVLVYRGLQATPPGLGADLASDAATTIPLTTLRHAVSEGEVRA